MLGSPANPIVYCLVVEAFPMNMPGLPITEFGRKTSHDYWTDDGA